MTLLPSQQSPKSSNPLAINHPVRFTIPHLSRRHHHRHRDPAHQKLHDAIDWTRAHLTATEHIPTHTPSYPIQEPPLDSDPSKPSHLFAQPTTPAMGSPFDHPHVHSLSAGQMEIATLAGGTAVLVSLLFVIVFIGVRGNKDVFDNRIGVAASLRRRRFFYERWRVPSFSQCADLSRKGSEALFRSRSNSRASSTSSSFEYPVFGNGPEEMEKNYMSDEAIYDTAANNMSRSFSPHPEELFIVPAYDLTPTQIVKSNQNDGPKVMTPRATRKNIIQCIAEWEAQEEEKYEKLLARVQEEEIQRMHWREIQQCRSSGSRARSVSRGRSHSRARLSHRKMTVSGVPGEPEMSEPF